MKFLRFKFEVCWGGGGGGGGERGREKGLNSFENKLKNVTHQNS